MQLLLTTNAGLEDLALQELQALGPATQVHSERGRLTVDTGVSLDQIRTLRSIHHVLEPLRAWAGSQWTLDQVTACVQELRVPALQDKPAFRVTALRSGPRFAGTQDIAAAVGAVLVARYAAPVSLENPAVNVRVEVTPTQLTASLQHTDRGLHLRLKRPYNQRVSLRTNVAWAMLRLARLPRDGVLLDPFCGGGTVLLEAAACRPDLTLMGSDIRLLAVQGCQENLTANAATATLAHRDALCLDEHHPAGSVDAVVTNPPFGLQLGKGLSFFPFYSELLEQLDHVLSADGRVVLLARQRGRFNAAVQRHGAFVVRHVRVVDMGGAHPGLFVLARRTPKGD